MSEPEAASNQADLDALGALEDAPELERIENLLDRYNVFETIGFVNDEAMHSNLLAFLPRRRVRGVGLRGGCHTRVGGLLIHTGRKRARK